MQSKQVSITIPYVKIDFSKLASEVFVSAKNIVRFAIYKTGRILHSSQTSNNEGNEFGFLFKLRRSLSKLTALVNKKAIAVLVIVFIAIIGFRSLDGNSDLTTNSDVRIKIQDAKAIETLNRNFSFPLLDSDGEEVSSIEYEIQKAELRDEIIVGGQRATSVSGRTFLVLTLKIKNDYNDAININTQDYIRLSVNGNEEEWLAPEVHNDPVRIQAISTKFTRLGFPINDTDTDLILRVGEINGDKENIALNINQ